MAKSIIKTDKKDLSLSAQDKKNLAVRIVGATLNSDVKTLYTLLCKNKDDDEVCFIILSGLFKTLENKGENFSRILSPINDTFFYFPEKGIKEFLLNFEKILQRKNYYSYSVAVIPDSNISKELFLEESFLGILRKLFTNIFFGNHSRHDGDDTFIVSDNIKLIFLMAASYEGIVTLDFKNKLSKIVAEALDTVYTLCFSSSKSKVWDARRSALDYFIKQLFIFNNYIDKNKQKLLLRRWQAWFLLEDQYKIGNKKVDRSKLKKEMLEIFKKVG